MNLHGFCVNQRILTETSAFELYYFNQYGVSFNDIKKIFEDRSAWEWEMQVQFERSKNGKPQVELKTHRVWVTDPQNPREMLDYLGDLNVMHRMIQTNKILQEGNHYWEHIFWVNDRKLLPKTVKWLEDNGFIIRELNQLTMDAFVLKRINILIEDGQLVQSADVARNLILAQEGGMYIDTDISIEQWDNEILYASDFIVAQEGFGPHDICLFNNDLLIARKNHPAIIETLNIYKQQFLEDAKTLNTSLLQNHRCFQDVRAIVPFQVGMYLQVTAIARTWDQMKDSVIFLRKKNPIKENVNPTYTISYKDGSEKQVTIIANSMDYGHWRDNYYDVLDFGFVQ
eukprot:403334996